MYLLMNKDNIVAAFEKKPGLVSDSYVIREQIGKFPYGFRNINQWLENRKASKHNGHLKSLMQACGCENTEGFIQLTHAASLNDSFWVKTDTENVSWKQASFYDNAFDETISKLAFEGVGLYGIQFSSTSPEMTTNGSFRKCWRREGDQIFLYKRGHSGAVNAGLEPYSECMASEIAALFSPDTVSYSLVRLHGAIASKCALFTSADVGYVPIACINQDFTADEMLGYYASLGAEDEFRRMLVIDSLTFNVDRHAGNHGVLTSNDSLEILGMAPIFDLNLALLPYVMRDEFQDIGSKLAEYEPAIGEDFTRVGQTMVTPGIRKTLINMKGFEFSFRGDEKYPEWRVKLMEQMVNRQIEALLAKDKLHTKDVFVPSSTICGTTKEAFAESKVAKIVDKIAETASLEFVGVQEIDGAMALIINIPNSEGTQICISSDTFVVWMLQDGKEVADVGEFLKNNECASMAYGELCCIVDKLTWTIDQ